MRKESGIDEEEVQRKRYDAALRGIYDELYELNISADSYRIIYHVEHKYVTPPERGVLSETIPLVAEHMIHPEDKENFYTFFDLSGMRAAFASGRQSLIGEFRKQWEDGSYHWASLTVLPMEGREEVYLCFIMDIDEAMKARKQLQHRAEFDTLTDIYNGNAFCQYAEELLHKSEGQKYAVVRIDINRFKMINDLYGREEGDRLLVHVAQVLRAGVPGGSVYGRLNSDVFVLCVPYETEKELAALVQRLEAQIRRYSLGYTIAASFGICTVEDRNVPVETLCDWANLALKTVKGNLIRQWAFYDDELRARQLEERRVEDEMERALEEGQFTVYLQPKHDIRTYEIIGAEALVRWIHPREGMLLPWRFIPLFEKNGFIVKLDEYVWEQTCMLLRKWIASGYKAVPISMNVSRIHVYNAGFAGHLVNLLGKYKLPSRLLELELTESTFVEHPEELYKIMETLKKKGLAFSMDDFGSGYSSLNMLKNAPVDTIKLDREFLNETTSTQKGQTIVRHAIAMARQLDLGVVAEGVETEQQANFLMKAGCVTAQGFYFSKPMPIEQFEKMAFHCG